MHKKLHCLHDFKRYITNPRGKWAPFISVSKYWIRNGLAAKIENSAAVRTYKLL